MKGETTLNAVQYRLCPLCARAVPITSFEHYCINDGTPLLEQCPKCQTAIYSPYTRNCAGCGYAFETHVGLNQHISEPRDTTPVHARASLFKRTSLVALLLVSLVLVLFLTQPARPKLQTVFVGKILQTQALIAIAINQERVLAYICDGTSIAQWFKGTTSPNNTLELRSKSGSVLKAKFDPDNAQGTIDLQGKLFAFHAVPARDQAALYRAERNTPKAVAGWILLSDGEQRAALVDQTGLRAVPNIGTFNPATLGLNLKPVNPTDPNGFAF